MGLVYACKVLRQYHCEPNKFLAKKQLDEGDELEIKVQYGINKRIHDL